MRAIQRVKKILKNINPLIRNYVIALIISRGRKNCAAMSHSTGIPNKHLYSFLSHSADAIQGMSELLQQLCQERRLPAAGKKALAVDPSHLIKPYAKFIEKLCYDRAGTTKRTERCLVPIYAMVIDQYATIPLSLKFWMQKKLTGPRLYKSKARLTQELILEARKNGVEFDFTPLDGAYAVPEMFDFFARTNEPFVMRHPKSRKITTADGISAQLQHHPALKLHRNERVKKVQATYQGRTYFFTAYKRRAKDYGYETVYLISNMDISAQQQIAAYDMRWPLEKVIRTTKQKFGAMQCQTLEIEKQQAHVLAGFLAYAILEIANNDKESQSVDELVNLIRNLYVDDLVRLVEKPVVNKLHKKDVPAAKPVQNSPHRSNRSAERVAGLNI